MSSTSSTTSPDDVDTVMRLGFGFPGGGGGVEGFDVPGLLPGRVCPLGQHLHLIGHVPRLAENAKTCSWRDT